MWSNKQPKLQIFNFNKPLKVRKNIKLWLCDSRNDLHPRGSVPSFRKKIMTACKFQRLKDHYQMVFTKSLQKNGFTLHKE